MRLIDAEKLDWWYKGRPIRRVIDEAPTVDAVPVVRCKDCKHRDKPTWMNGYYCGNPNYGMASGVELRDDDFCSYGERKDNE